MLHPVFDAYTCDVESVIPYDASRIQTMQLYVFEYIDNLHFLRLPSEFIHDVNRCTDLVVAAKQRFKEAGWEGTGQVSLLWIPPFVFPRNDAPRWEGVILWHVKQHSDGTSWILSPIDLPFEEFRG